MGGRFRSLPGRTKWDPGASHLGAPARASTRAPANLRPSGPTPRRRGGRVEPHRPLPPAPAPPAQSPLLRPSADPRLAPTPLLEAPSLLSTFSAPLALVLLPPYHSVTQPLLFLFSLTPLAYLSVWAFPPPLFSLPDTSDLSSPSRRLLPAHTLQVQAVSSCPLGPPAFFELLLGAGHRAGCWRVRGGCDPKPISRSIIT